NNQLMAGFTLRSLDNKSSVGFVSRIQRNIRALAHLGMKWDHELLQQSKAIGIAEAQMDSIYGLYYQQGQYMGIDVGQKEFIAFYDKEYPTRRDFLRKFAMNGEVEHVLEVIADETIIYDQNNFFGYPATQNLKAILKQDKAKEIIDDLNEAFKKVYFAFGFNEGHDAWHYCKKFLIDGFLAFEIIYDG
ncbi:MAG: portal protein, partial [Nitrosopumilus sp.]